LISFALTSVFTLVVFVWEKKNLSDMVATGPSHMPTAGVETSL